MLESCEMNESAMTQTVSFKREPKKTLKFTFADNAKGNVVFKRKEKIKHITDAAELMREASKAITHLGNTYAGGLTEKEITTSQKLILLSATLDRLKNAI